MQAIYDTVASKVQATDKSLSVTDDIVSLNQITTSYALGYVDSEILPKCFLPCKLVNDGTNISFTYDYAKGYYPCGYMSAVYVVNGNFTTEYLPIMQYWYKDSAGVKYYTSTTSQTNNTKRRYLNNFFPEYSGYVTRNNYSASMHFQGFVFDGGDNFVGTVTPSFSGWLNCLNFLHGSFSFTWSYSGSSFTISGSDFADDGTAYITSTDEMYKMRLFIVQYTFPEKTQTGLHFAVFNLDGSLFGSTASYLVGSNQQNANSSTILFTELDKFSPTYNNPSGLAGMHGTFNIEVIKSNPPYVYDGNVLARRSNSSSYSFQLFYSPSEILRHIAFMCRISYDSVNQGTDSYVDGVTYATHVSESDEFLGELITGDLSDDTFKAQLRPWQYSEDGAAVNTFDPENDIPAYPNPDNPDDPGSDVDVQPPLTEGDNMELQVNRRLSTANGFITLYNITASQLQAFGQTLWHSIADYVPGQIDPDTGFIMDNFYVRMAEEVTGTIDVGGILDFVVSVRMYPFSVATLPDLTTLGTSNIYFGTGKVGVPVGSAVRLLTSTIGVISCGTCYVRPTTPYNDFRDYYNTTVTAFLPYCGTVELNPIEILNNTLECYYAIDFYTGECTAYLMVDNGSNYYLAASKSGIIGVLLPVTATNSGQLSARHIADNARDASLMASAITNLFQGATAGAQGNVGGVGSAFSGLYDLGNQQQLLMAERQGRSAVLAPSLSGGSGGASFMLPDSAFVQIRRGTYDRPSNYPSTCGYPSTISGRLSSFSGYTQCYNVVTSGLTATADEQAMIKSLLESGVIV